MPPLARLVLVWQITCACCALATAEGSDRDPPHIVLIVADDLGWSDLSCQGSSMYRTPSIDRLAAEGVRLTSFYSNGPNCAPTRACLMSGLYPPRHGVYTVQNGDRGRSEFRKLVPPPNRTELATRFATLADRLHERSYTTGHFGKWHLGAASTGPTARGFDFNIAGNLRGAPASYFSPYRNPDIQDGPEDEYLTDRLTDEAIAWLDRSLRADPERRVFLYVPHYAVHTPIQARPEDVKTVKEDGLEPINLGYAAMIRSLDRSVGRILDALEGHGIAEETLVLFVSDNGGVGGYERLGLKTRDITDNTPLRGGKGMLLEGGIRVPFLARWPGVIPEGTVGDAPAITLDLFETCLDASGLDPRHVSSDGLSLLDYLQQADQVPTTLSEELRQRPLYWHFPGYLQANVREGTWRTTPASAIRVGTHKLIETFETGRIELYDLDVDPGETRDLTEERPELAEELHGRLRRWRAEVDAPMPTRVVSNPDR